ncbi:MAG TPA: response regulator [Pirellulales bacterium]|nr:response regulator [Pirellulales bacterium]
MTNRIRSQILMVDDDPDECENMADILNARGYRVDTAPGGRAALRLVDRQPYDLALLDLKMPGMDGLTLSRQLTRRHPGTVALLVTGYPDDVTPAEARAAGIRRVIRKPLDVPRLLATIEEALGDLAGSTHCGVG